MKLGTFTPAGSTALKAGLFADDGRVLDLMAAAARAAAADPGHFAVNYDVLCRAPGLHRWLTPEGQAAIRAIDRYTPGDAPAWQLVSAVRLGPPVPRPGKIIAVGRNYLDHLREGEKIWAARGRKVELPAFPSAFAKFPSSLCAAHEPILLPPGVEAVDYEVELAVVIGRPARNVGAAEALDFVAGYTICNDVGARKIQLAEMETQIGIVLAKNFPHFAPLGPWLVTADEIPDPQALHIALSVNGEARQAAHTGDMIFSVAKLVSYWSQIGLEPGDILSTGTPAGVAVARAEPDRFYLRDGDRVRATIEKIGTLDNPVQMQR